MVYIRVRLSVGLPGGSVIKNLPAMQETQEMQFQSLGWEVPLEEEMATHSSVLNRKSRGFSSILAWRIPWTVEPDRLQSTGSQRFGHD